jgi:hypothetical protein
MIEDVPIELANVHRHLGDPVYRIRWHGLRLTDGDLFIIFVAGWGSWTAFVMLGVEQVWYFSPALTLDPIGWLLSILITAVTLSYLHKFRPEGNTEEIIKALGNVKLYAPANSSCDKVWRPGVGRSIDQLRHD